MTHGRLEDNAPAPGLPQPSSAESEKIWLSPQAASSGPLLDINAPEVKSFLDQAPAGVYRARMVRPKLPEMAEDFVESSYLELNPDVAEACRRGEFSCGWEHFTSHGIWERRQYGTIAMTDPATGNRVPPPHLRRQISENLRVDHYLTEGRQSAELVGNALTPLGLTNGARVLDLGCGCGRVASPLKHRLPNVDLCGVDIDANAIAWCQRFLPQVAEFQTVNPLPPLPFADESFDFVYALSVFSHLPETMQFQWLDELRRVLKPLGVLLATLHGGTHLTGYYERHRRQWEEVGFVYDTKVPLVGHPEFYQTTFHSEPYVRRTWSTRFQILGYIECGAGGERPQDIVLCRKMVA